MKTWLFAGALGTILAIAVPAAADHNRALTPPIPDTERSLDIDLKLGPNSFRLGGRFLGRDGSTAGAWLNGALRGGGFSLDGRVERDGKAHDFRFDADLDEWLHRAIRRDVTDL